MADDGESNGDEDGVVASQVLVCNDSTNDWGGVAPERVESVDTERSTLTHSQSSRLTIGPRVLSSRLNNAVDLRKFPLNVVGVYNHELALWAWLWK